MIIGGINSNGGLLSSGALQDASASGLLSSNHHMDSLNEDMPMPGGENMSTYNPTSNMMNQGFPSNLLPPHPHTCGAAGGGSESCANS
jgi:hypothetical protein